MDLYRGLRVYTPIEIKIVRLTVHVGSKRVVCVFFISNKSEVYTVNHVKRTAEIRTEWATLSYPKMT